ncbi:hypothetical protein [Halomonas sp. N3-2A]|uniref:hypothetical protein n=1 Tax=Halomonas sp. N3-2A TaxID=2014541 RepID=UPI000B5B1966|nr:hypothetical protein [Halomonas sp. N3-2A]ASK18409.1 hypothetical protein CEK60_03390 [Halomonas sp. N3-2A]
MKLTAYDKPMTAPLSELEPLPGGKSRPSILGNADYVADLKTRTKGKVVAAKWGLALNTVWQHRSMLRKRGML